MTHSLKLKSETITITKWPVNGCEHKRIEVSDSEIRGHVVQKCKDCGAERTIPGYWERVQCALDSGKFRYRLRSKGERYQNNQNEVLLSTRGQLRG